MKQKLTSKAVKQLYAMMTQYYDTELIEHWNEDRETSMAVLTLYLGAIGVKNVPYFLENCDISMGCEIYLPHEPGEGRDRGDLWIDVIGCVSTHQRVLHLRECDRPAECELLYLLSPVNRVYAELAALRASLEVCQWSQITREVDWDSEWMNKYDFLGDLKLYGCTDIALEVTESQARLTQMIKDVQNGEVTCEAARDVIRFFGWDTADARG